MSTYILKAGDIKKKWLLIDASNLVVGRLASQVASYLKGKHKPEFSPNLDCGDHVVIINAEKAKFTGKKFENKKYYWHTGFAGGIKDTTPKTLHREEKAERVIEKAVQRMLSRDALGRLQFSNLRVYKGAEHPHAGQNPEVVDFGSKNRKNKIGG